MQNRGDKVSKQNEWKEWLQKQTTLQPKTTLQETITSIDKINEILLNSSPDFIFRVSREGVYLDYKAEDEKELYYSPSNFLGKSMTDLFPPSIAIKATQCITTTVTTGENTAYSYELNYNGLWKTFIASFSKFNAEECLILVQEAKAPSSNRKRAAGPFSYTTYTIEPKEKRLKKRDKYNLPMKSNSAESLLGSLSPSKVLKMLVITSQPLWNADGNEPVTLLDGQNERHSISQGIRISTLSVKISFLREATLGNVMNALKGGWDFIHISAHGTKDTIWLEDGLGCTYNLSVDEFASCFTTNTTTKLVVISACHTLEIGRLVYDTLSKNGVRQVNVIAIQGSMSDSASAVFAQCFYQALGNSSINDAFASAQKSLSKSPIVTDSDLETEESLLPWSDRFMLFGEKSMSFASNSAYKGGIVEETYLPEINVVSNLPKLSSNFIGREKDLVEVVRLFEKEKIPRVCVFGPGGIGKTEFAKLVASWMKERGHVQTVLWSSSEPAEIDTQVNDILSLIEQAKSLFNLNFSETLLEKQKSYIYQYLRNNNTLIVIDSWENIKVKDRWPIWTFLNSLPYNTRVLITSRDILPAIEVHNYELDRLDNRKARILFWNTLRNAGYFKDRKALTVEEVEVLTDIVRTLEGYPLAIIIAAGQSRSKTLKQIKQEFLNKPKMVLEAVNEITAQPQGIWTSLNVSYDTLTLTEQRVFRQMCIFPEAILDVAIQAVTSIEENELHNILDVLVRRSLIRRAKNLFALHKIIQEYGKSKLIEEGEDLTVLHQRVITYYQNKFSEDGNMENLLSTHYHLVILFETFKNLQAGQLILERFQLLFLHLVFIGDYAKAIQITEEVLSVANKLNNKKLTIQAYRSLGDITLHSKMKVETATKYISESLKMALELSDNHEIVKCLNSQGYLVYLLEDLNGAKKILHESLNLSRSLADVNEEDIAETLTLLGAVYTEEDNYAEAKFLLEQSLDLLQTTISNLEKLQKDSSKMNSTIYYRIKASKWKQAAAISFFARLEYKKGDLEVTKKLYLSQLKISKEMDNAIGIAECLYQLGTIEQLLKDYNEATNLYSMALKVAHGVQAFDKVIMITYNMAELAKIMNDPEKARLLYAESLQNALLNYDARMAIRVQLSWARLEVETNNLDKSATLLRRALNVAMQLKDNVLMEKIQRYIVLVDTKDPSLRLDWSQDDSSAFD